MHCVRIVCVYLHLKNHIYNFNTLDLLVEVRVCRLLMFMYCAKNRYQQVPVPNTILYQGTK